MKSTIRQLVYNNTANYDKIVDQFIKGMMVDSNIKRVNFLVFKKEGSFTDRFIPFMGKDNYLNKKMSENRIMFNLIETDLACCDQWTLKQVLIKRKENLSIVLVDAYQETIKKDDLKLINFYIKLNDEIINLKNRLKTIAKTNNEVPVYVMAIPREEGQTSKLVNTVLKVIDMINKLIISKYSQVTYIETVVTNEANMKTKTTYGFGQMAYLLNVINQTVVKKQFKSVLAKKEVLLETKHSFGRLKTRYENLNPISTIQ